MWSRGRPDRMSAGRPPSLVPLWSAETLSPDRALRSEGRGEAEPAGLPRPSEGEGSGVRVSHFRSTPKRMIARSPLISS